MTTLCIDDASPELRKRLAEAKNKLKAAGTHITQRGQQRRSQNEPQLHERPTFTINKSVNLAQLKAALDAAGFQFVNGELR